MIGSGLKGFAQEHGMAVENGIAYGSIDGYTFTMYEGMGTKTICVNARSSNKSMREELEREFKSEECRQKYRLSNTECVKNGIIFTFFDNPGTMDCIKNFLDSLTVKLKECEFEGNEKCCVCGQPISAGTYVKENGIATLAHESCVLREEQKGHDSLKEKESKNILKGTLGAIAGGLIGSIPWAIVYMFNFFVGWLGFLIGFLAKKGYELCKGKPGTAKVWIVIIVTIFSVAFATLLGNGLGFARAIANGELGDFAYSDIPMLLSFSLLDSEFLGYVIKDFLFGLLFAFLGIWGIIGDLKREKQYNSEKGLKRL